MNRCYVLIFLVWLGSCAPPSAPPAKRLNAYELGVQAHVLHPEKKWHCLFTFNPNDCAMCLAGFGGVYRQLSAAEKPGIETVLILPEIRPAERKALLAGQPFDSLRTPLVFNDSLYHRTNDAVKPGSGYSSIVVYDAKGKLRYASFTHSTIDVPALQQLMR